MIIERLQNTYLMIITMYFCFAVTVICMKSPKTNKNSYIGVSISTFLGIRGTCGVMGKNQN